MPATAPATATQEANTTAELKHAVAGRPATPGKEAVLEPLNDNEASPEEDKPRRALERWNRPRSNAYRFLVTNYSFIVMGMNDGAVGALVPYVSFFTLLRDSAALYATG
jgi:hypothetical protein